MYLCQDILQYSIVPILEPLELVSFSMTSILFHKVVEDHIPKTVIGRVNNILVEYFGADVDKFKQFMNNTGTFITNESMLQCVIDGYWEIESPEYLYLYNEAAFGGNKSDIIRLINNLGFKREICFWNNMDLYEKGTKTICMAYVSPLERNTWLNNFKSKYYIRDNIEKVEIVPSFGSLICKTVVYDEINYHTGIVNTLRRLKDNGFKINIEFDQMYNVIGNHSYVELFTVSFIGYTYLEDGKMQYNYEYKGGKKYFLPDDGYNPSIHCVGDIVSFCSELKFYDCPADCGCSLNICDCNNVHFHHNVYIRESDSDIDCIFVIV